MRLKFPEFLNREKKFFLIILAVFFGGLLAIGLIVDNLIMPIIVHHGSEFTLPQIVNLPIKVAEKKLKDLKLNLVVTGEEYNSYFPIGTVISQVPEPGTTVKKGSTIRAIISKGEASATMPAVRGLSLREAKLLIENANLTVGEITWYEDEGFPDGVVVESYPVAGTVLKANSSVQLVVNRLETDVKVDVPNFIGLDLAEAKKLAEENGILVSDIKYRKDERMLPETVLSQSLAPGTKVPKWTEVKLIVSQSE
ncbi:MAG: PASTA domain-containing protein [candidate division Zixibacteria bacterium]|nr:PASTA domain-containing protein [candidate division Zixibacteria bacterium]